MSTVLFNFHDLVLLTTAVLSGLLACMLFVFQGPDRRISNYLLGAFLLLYAIVPLDKLITYGAEFRYVALEFSLDIYLFGNAALLAEGPLLYLYTRSVAQKEFKLTRYHLLHFIPVVLYFFYAYAMYYRFDEFTKYQLILKLEVFHHWSFSYFHGARDLLRMVYGVMSIYVLFQYQALIRERYSEVRKIDMQWLVRILFGFMIYRSWMFIESFYSAAYIFINNDASINYVKVMELSGLFNGYVAFFLLIMLIFFALRYSFVLEGVDFASNAGNRSVSLDWKLADRVSEYMQKEKPYLEQNITIEQLSKKLSIPVKTFSVLLNRHFGKNFFEFINGYRVEEAKNMLSKDEYSDVTIVDIMNESGFSSKSAFNDFFKRVEGITPREYRKKKTNEKK